MVSESHMRKDIRTGRHNSGLNHQAHLRKHPGHLNQIAASRNAAFNRSLNTGSVVIAGSGSFAGAGAIAGGAGAVAVAGSGTVGLGGCNHRKCGSCGGCNCCG